MQNCEWFQEHCTEAYQLELMKRDKLNERVEKIYTLLIPIIGVIAYLLSQLTIASFSSYLLSNCFLGICLSLFANIFVVITYYPKNDYRHSYYGKMLLIIGIGFLALSVIYFHLASIRFSAKYNGHDLYLAFLIFTLLSMCIEIIIVMRSMIIYKYKFIWQPGQIIEYGETIKEYNKKYNIGTKYDEYVKMRHCISCSEAADINQESNIAKEASLSIMRRELYIIVVSIAFCYIINFINTLGVGK